MTRPAPIVELVDELIEIIRPVLLGEPYQAEALVGELTMREEQLRLSGEAELIAPVTAVRELLESGDTDELLPAVFALQDLLDAALPDPLEDAGGDEDREVRLELDLADERAEVLKLDRRTRMAIREARAAGLTAYLVQIEGPGDDPTREIAAIERAVTTIRSRRFPALQRTILLVVAEQDPTTTIREALETERDRASAGDVSVRPLDSATITRESGVARDWYDRMPPISVVPDSAALERTQYYLDQVDSGAPVNPALLAELRSALASVARVELTAVLEQLRPMLEHMALESRKRVRISIAGLAPPIGVEVAGTLRPVLLELITNAIQHGIEEPDERVEAGKPATGHIDIAVSHANDLFTVRVRDDGRGIDEAEVRAAVRNPARGLSQAKRLLAERLGGNLTIRSGGAGTVVRVGVAALDAIFRAICFTRAGRHFALPAAQVVALEEWEAYRVTRDVIGNRYFRYDGRPVPVREPRPLVEPEEAREATEPSERAGFLSILALAELIVAVPADGQPRERLIVRTERGRGRAVEGEREAMLIPDIGALFD